MQYTTDDGETITIDPQDLTVEDGDDVTDVPGVQDELNRVAGKTRKQAQQSLKSDLLTDDSFFEEAAQRRGIELRDDGRPKGATAKEDLKELKQELARARQKADRAEELEQEVSSLRETKLDNQLVQHADAVKDDLKDLFLESAKQNFTFDETTGDYVPVGEDGEPDYARSTEDVVQEILEDRPSLAKDRSAQGSPQDQPGSTSASGRVYTAEEAKEIATKARQGDAEAQEKLADVKEAMQDARISE